MIRRKVDLWDAAADLRALAGDRAHRFEAGDDLLGLFKSDRPIKAMWLLGLPLHRGGACAPNELRLFDEAGDLLGGWLAPIE